MSEGFTPASPQHDRLPSRLILAVGGAWFVIIIVAALAVWWWKGMSGPAAPAETPAQVGSAEIGIVNQRPFALEKGAPQLRAEQLERLESYGWADRPAGVIHIPIERAMEQVLAQEGRGP